MSFSVNWFPRSRSNCSFWLFKSSSAARHGETFKALYDGKDLQNNHSNSDMALMTRLAFWCNGDKDQMLRIFATSGLYRPDKSPEYYEHTALKAVRENSNRYEPKRTNKPSKPPAKIIQAGTVSKHYKGMAAVFTAAILKNSIYLSSRNLTILKCLMPFLEKSGISPEMTYFG